MLTQRQILSKIKDEEALKLVAAVYTEISAARLLKIRAGIEHNRDYYGQIYEVFSTAANIAHAKGLRPRESKSGSSAILLTSNQRFYGRIENELIKSYINDTKDKAIDRIIIGRTGGEYLKAMEEKFARSFIFHSDLPDEKEQKELSLAVSAYKTVLVYYSRFETVLTQKPFSADITVTPSEVKTADIREKHYIFEPEIEKILLFFIRQFSEALLHHAFLEAQLARTAARLVSMEQAQINAEETLKRERLELALARRSAQNAVVLEMAGRRI